LSHPSSVQRNTRLPRRGYFMRAERGFVVAAVSLEVVAASVRPPLLIAVREVAHAPKGRFGGVRVLVVLPVVVGFLVVRVVVNRVLELPGNIVVGLVSRNWIRRSISSRAFATAPYGLKGLFRGDWGLVVDRGIRRCRLARGAGRAIALAPAHDGTTRFPSASTSVTTNVGPSSSNIQVRSAGSRRGRPRH
jgi:hypothetical protein